MMRHLHLSIIAASMVRGVEAVWKLLHPRVDRNEGKGYNSQS